jgi:hypothetical protein
MTLGIALFILFSLTACTADIDGQHKGLSIGFNHTGPKYYPIMMAVRSDKQVFDIDDVTLDLYCGYFVWDSSNIGNGDNFHVVFYIKEMETGYWIDPQQDYHNVEGQYFLTEVPEFNTKVFAASQTRRTGKIFNYSENITIPKEAFKHQIGVLIFHAVIINFSNEDNLYHFNGSLSDSILIEYTINNDNTVSLS